MKSFEIRAYQEASELYYIVIEARNEKDALRKAVDKWRNAWDEWIYDETLVDGGEVRIESDNYEEVLR
jgi:hypothetical protein